MPQLILAQTRSYVNISAVLKTASVLAIFDATLKSFDTKHATDNVLTIAKTLHNNAFANDRRAPSVPPDFRPAWLLFIRRSPINIVNDLDRKSDETIANASEIECENEYDVTNVIDPATRRQTNAFTADLMAVSSKTAFVFFFRAELLRRYCSEAPSWYGTARADSSDDDDDDDEDEDEEDKSWFGID